MVWDDQLSAAQTLIGSSRSEDLLKYTTRALAKLNNGPPPSSGSPKRIHGYLPGTLALSLASFTVLLVMWLTCIRPVRRWGGELEEAHFKTRLANQQLAAAQTEL